MDRRLLSFLPLSASLAIWLAIAPARAQTSPHLSQAPKADLAVVEQIVQERASLVVRRQAMVQPMTARHGGVRRRHLARRFHVPRDLERPALAGVELLRPLPLPGEPPHIIVPLPAYPLDSVVTAYTTPPPPIVCHPARRDPDAPDPHLYRETPVVCEPDNP